METASMDSSCGKEADIGGRKCGNGKRAFGGVAPSSPR